MAIKHVVTRGYGFADGTVFIPTRGYTPATLVVSLVGYIYSSIASATLKSGAATSAIKSGAASITVKE